jgi:Xaa-Pro dipeptidase
MIYETGFGFGMQNKDMILVTPQDCELLSNYLDTNDLLVV